jgi:colanic acid biosynthesis glycosyl transferase WcaI
MEQNRSTRLLVVAINFAPELTGIGKYVGEMTDWLAGQQVSIRVVTAPPYYPAWSVDPNYRGSRYMREQLNGVRVYRCPLWVPRVPRGLTRLLHLLSFGLSSLPVTLWQALFWRPDLVFVVEPALCAAPGAWLAARLGGAKAWLHIQDFEVDAAFELGLLGNSRVRRVVLAIERWLLRRFDHVSTISDGMIAKGLNKGVQKDRLLQFPNWVDVELIRPLHGTNQLRTELGIADGQRVLLYSGNMGEKQGLEVLVDVARRFSEDRDILFLLCGDGAVRPRLSRATARMSNVRMIPLQPLERLNELLNLADVHLLPQRAAAEDLVLPSKLGAILASGRPVVATARRGSDVARYADCGGLVVPPGDTVAFEEAIRRLLDDPALSRQFGAAGRALAVATWEREAVMRRTFSQFSVFREFVRAPASPDAAFPRTATMDAEEQLVEL